MKLKNFLISSMLILSLVLFIGCASDGSSKTSNVPDATKGEPQWWLNMKGPAYQVLVYSFADSDGDVKYELHYPQLIITKADGSQLEFTFSDRMTFAIGGNSSIVYHRK
jgi:hypothetical protein